MNLQLRPALVSFAALSVLTGLAYPALVAGLAKVVFPRQAAGSLVHKDNKVIGSELIGQSFTDPGHFWGRPSSTSGPDGKPLPYNGGNSGGSNLAPSNPGLKKAVEERIAALKAADPEQQGLVPVDLVTASGSGLDPHISPAAAAYQIHRVAKARALDQSRVQALVAAHTEQPQFGVLGDVRVNVLKLNMDLDGLR
ncbi:MAG: potassium-transporting ATPase subunit KdpC [Holophagaceae bacterium]|nr:potassium-transporting ATPase subunit KdpC [Holophagaceae bacterium]